MANQIAKFFAHQGEAKAVPAIADHIKKYWEPRMRTAILVHLAAGGTGLDPMVAKALSTLSESSGALPDLARR